MKHKTQIIIDFVVGLLLLAIIAWAVTKSEAATPCDGNIHTSRLDYDPAERIRECRRDSVLKVFADYILGHDIEITWLMPPDDTLWEFPLAPSDSAGWGRKGE